MLRMVEIQPMAGRNLRALRTDGKARRTFVLRALFTPCLGVAAQQRRRMAAYLLPEPASAGAGLGGAAQLRRRVAGRVAGLAYLWVL